MQEAVPAGTPTFGMGGITMPPRDLCIFWSLQCRYCREVCTWERRRRKVWPRETCPRDTHPRGPSHRMALPLGAAWVGSSAGSVLRFPSQPHSPGTREAHCFLTTPGDEPARGPFIPAPIPFLLLAFCSHFRKILDHQGWEGSSKASGPTPSSYRCATGAQGGR